MVDPKNESKKKKERLIVIRAETISDSNNEVTIEVHATIKSMKGCIPICRRDDNPQLFIERAASEEQVPKEVEKD